MKTSLLHVTPLGDIVESGSSYAFFGNRGNLHNPQRQLTRAPNSRGWIICRTDKLGAPETFMQPGRMTELFFLDEATGFAAGHRPCFRCRYRDAERFADAWRMGNDRPSASLADIDDTIRAERELGLLGARPDELPDGTMIDAGGPMVIHGPDVYGWSLDGYRGAEPAIKRAVPVITPRSVVAAFRSGYSPQIDRLPPKSTSI